MRADEIHPGDLVAGKYRVRTILGRKHGLLLDAFHTEFDQRVVVKLLLAGHGDDKEIERFRREARTLSKLESEHVARIIDVGMQPDGSFYLVRQFLDGADLDTQVRQHGPMPLDVAVLYLLQAAEAVAETHGHGIIVREIEPRNLFLTQRAGGHCVKIIDFGTAKLMRDLAAPTAGGEFTATAMFGLSPFSSPELVRKAKNVDARTDVWSLGACLYHFLTGRPPFSGETGMLMLQIAKEEPIPVSHLRPDLPPEMESILRWALAKDVDARFRDVHALAHALAPFATPEGQVIIERIGRMSEAARSRRASIPPLPPPSAPPYSVRPSSPPSLPRSGALRTVDFDDSITESRSLVAPSQRPPRLEPPSVRPPPVPPPSMRPGAIGPPSIRPVPPPVPSVRPVPPAPPSVRPPMSSPPPSSVPAPVPGTYALPSPPGTMPPSSLLSAAHSMPYPTLPQPASRLALDCRVTLGALAAAAVLLPMIIAVLLLRNSGGDAAAEMSDPRISIAPAKAMPPAQDTPRVVPAATAPPSAAVIIVSPNELPSRPSVPVVVGGGPKPAPAPKQAPTPVAKQAPEPQQDPEPDPPQASGATGTLVAVATGGNCAFSVNGASKGSGASTKVQLKPGTYSVTCKSSGGAVKSRSVTVKSGETSMVSFKL